MIFRKIHLQVFEPIRSTELLSPENERNSSKSCKKSMGNIFFDNDYHLRKLSLSKSLINGLEDFFLNP